MRCEKRKKERKITETETVAVSDEQFAAQSGQGRVQEDEDDEQGVCFSKSVF